MNIYANIRRFFAAHASASENYDQLLDLEIFFNDFGVSFEQDFSTVQNVIRYELSSKTNQAVSAIITGSLIDALLSDLKVFKKGLEDIIAGADAVAKPNGTTKMLRRIAVDTIDHQRSAPAATTKAA